MWSDTKYLVIASFLIIFAGLAFLWFGLQPFLPPIPFSSSPMPSAFQESSYEASVSAIPAQSDSAVQAVEGERVLVTQVVDGDTIKVSLKGQEKTVRFVGMDTPETVDPRHPVGCFGKEASNETKSLLYSKIVILQKDVSDTDKYKRLLRYIFLPLDNGQTLFVNDYLVREGFAKVYTYPPDVKFNEQFLKAEREARISKKGLWGRC